MALGGRLHLVGGRTKDGDTGRHDVYDPAADRWTVAAPMPTARDHAAAAVVNGVLHVAAGRPGGMTVHEAYDPRSGRWAGKNKDVKDAKDIKDKRELSRLWLLSLPSLVSFLFAQTPPPEPSPATPPPAHKACPAHRLN